MSRMLYLLFGVCLALAQPGCSEAGGGDDSVDASATTPDGGGGGGQCSFCTADQMCCGGFCVDVSSNATHCGTCNNSCSQPSSDTCSLSTCTCNFGPACTGADTCCVGVGCRDLDSDPQNCGMCGRQCGANETCSGGECSCQGEDCANGDTCCGTGCTDTTSDDANCGMCGMACTASETCMNSTCVCAAQCSPDTIVEGCCDSGCVDLCFDSQNCGMCGNDCGGEACDNGLCDGQIGFPLFECLFPM